MASAIGLNSWKKDEDEDTEDSSVNKVLVIDNGVQSLEPGESLTSSAKLVDDAGNVSIADNITWSVSPDSVASFDGSVLSGTATGKAKVTASVTVDGEEITASVPIGVYLPSVFTVAPAAILFEANHDVPLTPVYFGQNEASYSYSSSDVSVASVSSSGVVTLNSSGECVVTVTATIDGNDYTVDVPVMVIGPPSVSLPVTRVELNNYSIDLFKDETPLLSASAYNADGEVADAEISFASADPEIATVSDEGQISPVRTGKTYVTWRKDYWYA